MRLSHLQRMMYLVPVDALHMPPVSLKAGQSIVGKRKMRRAVDGNAVIVPQHNKLTQWT
jgi:hypothetical protein